MTKSRLCIDECVLHYLTGVSSRDERLAGIVKPLWCNSGLVPSHSRLADNIAMAWSQRRGKSALPVVMLYGDDDTGKQEIATAGCAELEMKSVLREEAERLNSKLGMIVSQFDLSAQAIRHAGSGILCYLDASGSGSSQDGIGKMLWDECRESTRPRLDDLAQRIEPVATFDDIVLPELQRQILK